MTPGRARPGVYAAFVVGVAIILLMVLMAGCEEPRFAHGGTNPAGYLSPRAYEPADFRAGSEMRVPQVSRSEKRKPVKVSKQVSKPKAVVPQAPQGFTAWLNSPTAKLVIARESHGICTVVSASGKYQGKWQMDDNFWRSYGGLKYAANPHQASCHAQDLVAYRGWLARGWQPWPTAH